MTQMILNEDFKMLESFIEKYDFGVGEERATSLINGACFYTLLDDDSEAIDWLDESIDILKSFLK